MTNKHKNSSTKSVPFCVNWVVKVDWLSVSCHTGMVIRRNEVCQASVVTRMENKPRKIRRIVGCMPTDSY